MSSTNSSVLVTMELLKALSAVSLDSSLLVVQPWHNPWLIPGVVVPFALHLLVVYCKPLAALFGLSPLSIKEWKVEPFRFLNFLINSFSIFTFYCLSVFTYVRSFIFPPSSFTLFLSLSPAPLLLSLISHLSPLPHLFLLPLISFISPLFSPSLSSPSQ